MEHSKEFYQSVVRVIDYLNDGHDEVPKDKGHELAGNYWREIGKLFADNTPCSFFEYGRFSINHSEDLGPIYENCKHLLKSIDKAEHDRKLNNRGIKVAIWSAILGLIVSFCSLIWTIHADKQLDELEERVLKLEQTVAPS